MDMGVRLIHTADWQIGLRAGHIPGDDGAAVRNERFEVIGRIARVAKDTDAHFVVVAGDVFEHHQLHRENTQKTFEALRGFHCPVFLLPGNHDPYTPDALYRTEWWSRECPSNVTVLGRPDAFTTERFTILPCPLTDRHIHQPTAWLDARPGPHDRVRVGIAHGGVKEFLVGRADPDTMMNDIPYHLAERARLDYLALGDWHGPGKVNERTWYSGTPEATCFEEKLPGDVLAVSIETPGAVPVVQPVRVARFAWHRLERTLLTAGDVQALENELDAMPSRATTLVEIDLLGYLDLTLHTRVVTGFAARYKGSFRHLRMKTERLHVRLSEEDFAALPREGWIGRVVQQLREGRIEGTTPEACHRALQQLHRIQVELQLGGGAR